MSFGKGIRDASGGDAAMIDDSRGGGDDEQSVNEIKNVTKLERVENISMAHVR